MNMEIHLKGVVIQTWKQYLSKHKDSPECFDRGP